MAIRRESMVRNSETQGCVAHSATWQNAMSVDGPAIHFYAVFDCDSEFMKRNAEGERRSDFDPALLSMAAMLQKEAKKVNGALEDVEEELTEDELGEEEGEEAVEDEAEHGEPRDEFTSGARGG